MGKGKRKGEGKTTQTAHEDGSRTENTSQRFDGQLPPILPELQWPDEMKARIGDGALRRLELTQRAYSAAVFVHRDLFVPRLESLVAGFTRKLFTIEKEQLLMLFEKECHAVLGGLREGLPMMRAIPPAERVAFLKDYQAWVRQVKELLREAVFADEAETWNQEMLDLFQRHKPGEPCPQEALSHLMKKPVFVEHLYFTRFNDLLLAQMELEQQLGLMLDIVLDLMKAHETRMQGERRLRIEQKQKRPSQVSEALDGQIEQNLPAPEKAHEAVTGGAYADCPELFKRAYLLTARVEFVVENAEGLREASEGLAQRLQDHDIDVAELLSDPEMMSRGAAWGQLPTPPETVLCGIELYRFFVGERLEGILLAFDAAAMQIRNIIMDICYLPQSLAGQPLSPLLARFLDYRREYREYLERAIREGRRDRIKEQALRQQLMNHVLSIGVTVNEIGERLRMAKNGTKQPGATVTGEPPQLEGDAYTILCTLADSPTRLKQVDLQHCTRPRMDRKTVSKHLKILAKDGLVEYDAKNKKGASITSQGRAFFERGS